MDFTDDELHNLLTAVADQRTYYRQAANQCTEHDAANRNQRHFYLDKLAENQALYVKLQTALMARETAEIL